jgi:hypothetical protein
VPFLCLRLAQKSNSSSTEATPLAADVQITIPEPDPTFPTLVQLAGVCRVAPSCRPGQRRPVGEPLNPRRPLLGFPRGEPIAGKMRTLRRRSCSDRAARSPPCRFGAPLALGLACGRFYRRPTCAGKTRPTQHRAARVRPRSGPMHFFTGNSIVICFRSMKLLKSVEK